MLRTMSVIGIVGLTLTAASPSAAQDRLTYNQHVGQILLDNCATCHRPNQVAPMSLLSYVDARPWARAIKAKVVSREMPPWYADPRYGTFTNDPSLSDAEIAAIVAWVDGGAPEGDGAAPNPPHFSEAGWRGPSGRDPDWVYDFPIEWHVDAEGEFPNFNLVTPNPLREAVQIEATEVRPGNYRATHHISTSLFNIPPGMKVGTGPVWPGGPVSDYVLVRDPDADPELLERFLGLAEQFAGAAGGDGGDGAGLNADATARSGYGAYVSGVGAVVTPKGFYQVIQGDRSTHIMWNLHYQATGQPETARPSIGVWFATEETTTRAHALGLPESISESEQLVSPGPASRADARALIKAFLTGESIQVGQFLNPLLKPIPPSHGNYTITGIGAFRQDAQIMSLYAHAHLRGKDFTYVLTYPDGREEILLRIPKYDFDWQFTYYLAEPVLAPAGSTLKVMARYDNSRANRKNPAPDKQVFWSEQSWDDMFLSHVTYTLADDNATQGEN